MKRKRICTLGGHLTGGELRWREREPQRLREKCSCWNEEGREREREREGRKRKRSRTGRGREAAEDRTARRGCTAPITPSTWGDGTCGHQHPSYSSHTRRHIPSGSRAWPYRGSRGTHQLQPPWASMPGRALTCRWWEVITGLFPGHQTSSFICLRA